MKNPDKFLIGIVAGVLLLVIVSAAVGLLQPEPAYLPDDSPENVVQNYILAVLQGDYERAFGYVYPRIAAAPENPNVLGVQISIFDLPRNESDRYAIEFVSVTGDLARITVSVNGDYSSGPLFGRIQYSYDRDFQLRPLDGQWKIFYGEVFFPRCWTQRNGCD